MNRQGFFIAWLFFSLALAPLAMAKPDQAGHLIAGSGRVAARSESGAERALRRRDPVYLGDTVLVGDNGFAQIRFIDGGLASLRPSSELRIRDYRFAGAEDGNERAVLDLVKGGLRTITGAIGRTNRENYKVETPVATIGIRGTHYALRWCASDACGTGYDDGLYGGVLGGAIGVVNAGGDVTFGVDRYFYVSDRDTAARALRAPPGNLFDAYAAAEVPPSAPTADAFIAPAAAGLPPQDAALAADLPERTAYPLDLELGELRTASGYHQDHQPGPDPGPNPGPDPGPGPDPDPPTPPDQGNAPDGAMAIVAGKVHDAAGQAAWYAAGAQQGLSGEAVWVGSVDGHANTLTAASFLHPSGCEPLCDFTMGESGLAEWNTVASDGAPVVTYGRWDWGWGFEGAAGVGEGYAQGHWAYSPDLTTQAGLNALKAAGLVAYYVPAGGTIPTDESGIQGYYLPDLPEMKVDFATSEILAFDVGVDFPEAGRVFYGSLAAPVAFAGAEEGFPLVVSCSGCSAANGSGDADVAFLGDGADYAMGGFALHTPDDETATGTFVLQQSDGGAGPVDPDVPDGPAVTPVAAGTSAIVSLLALPEDSTNVKSVVWQAEDGADGVELFLVDVDSHSGVLYGKRIDDEPRLWGDEGALMEAGALDAPNSPAVSWGAWASGHNVLADSSGVTQDVQGSWHYVMSPDLTTQADLDLLKSDLVLGYFDPLAGTTPTDKAGNPGMYMEYSPRMTVDFGTGQITEFFVGVDVAATGRSFEGQLPAPVSFSGAQTNHLNLEVFCNGCNSDVAGGRTALQFLGDRASHAAGAFYLFTLDDSVQGAYVLEHASSYPGHSAAASTMRRIRR